MLCAASDRPVAVRLWGSEISSGARQQSCSAAWEDGVLELRPTVAVPVADAWFWAEDWQAGEREVNAHVDRGEVMVTATVEGFLADLDALDAE